jgi:hypothetical protein
MKCENCGWETEGEGKPCAQCGKEAPVTAPTIGAPGSAGPPMANGSDEVRNSQAPKPEVVVPGLANPGRPPGDIVEGTGG